MIAGHVVLLNGVSSSGKSSIATELQGMLPRPFLKASIDTFAPMIPDRLIAFDPPRTTGPSTDCVSKRIMVPPARL